VSVPGVEDKDFNVHVTLSHEVGGLGLLERENAAILNASLRPLAATLVPQMREALHALHLKGQLFFTANDGTLTSFERALKVCCNSIFTVLLRASLRFSAEK
jgi:N-methylhydantoinase A/oxoprolinase/acetone carboxylase beta subunit